MSSHTPTPSFDKKKANTLITIGIVAIILIALFGMFTLYVTIADAPVRATSTTPVPATYTSATYKYSFTYPGEYAVDEYTPEYVSIGTSTGTDSFDAVAEVDVLTADASDTSRSFTDFAHTQAERTCDADGPTASISCPKVSRSLTFTTKAGQVGEEFYLIEDTRSIAAGSLSETERGPYFSFNLTGTIPGALYPVLLVRPPSATDSDNIVDALVRGVAESIVLPEAGK